MNEFIIIKNESKIFRIKKDQILSVSVESGISSFLLENGKLINKTMSLKNALKMLSAEFTQISRNCAVNINKISEVNKQSRVITLFNNTNYKISVRNIKTLIDTLN